MSGEIALPVRIEHFPRKGRWAAKYNLVDAEGQYIMGGFPSWQVGTLRRIAAALNAVDSIEHEIARRFVELRECSR